MAVTNLLSICAFLGVINKDNPGGELKDVAGGGKGVNVLLSDEGTLTHRVGMKGFGGMSRRIAVVSLCNANKIHLRNLFHSRRREAHIPACFPVLEYFVCLFQTYSAACSLEVILGTFMTNWWVISMKPESDSLIESRFQDSSGLCNKSDGEIPI